ncbi:hypothetical protein N9I19_05145 [Peribacillus sp. CSMR9]|nr:hypothetical protein [Peribacillus sp. CSMR9]
MHFFADKKGFFIYNRNKKNRRIKKGGKQDGICGSIYDKNDLPRMRKAIKRQVNGDRNLLLFRARVGDGPTAW